MKLWEIKAQALRLMFADADIEFSYTEFAEETVYNNANTREKLVRMEDSIRRAIDIYHQYSEKITKTTSLLLKNNGKWRRYNLFKRTWFKWHQRFW